MAITKICGGKRVTFKSKEAKRKYEAFKHIHLKKSSKKKK